MQILMNNIHRKIRSNSDRKMFRQMKAQIVMIGRLKLQIQPTVNEPPPDGLPSSRSFGLAEEQVLQRRRQLEGDVRLERPQQVAVGDVGQRDLHRRRAGAFVPRCDHERLAVGAPFGTGRAGALRPQADEGADARIGRPARRSVRAAASCRRSAWRPRATARWPAAFVPPRPAPATTPASRDAALPRIALEQHAARER